MSEWKGIRITWRNLSRRRDVEEAVGDELEFHLDMAARQIMEREGLTEAEARTEAERRFGDGARYSSECMRMAEQERRSRAIGFVLNDLLMDLRFGVRQIRKTPGVTAAAVLSLAIGIGAGTSIYEIARYALFPDTAITEPERIVRVYSKIPEAVAQGVEHAPLSWLDYEDMKDQAGCFEDLAAATIRPFHLSDGDLPERVWGEMVTANYFSTLGVPMALGRDLHPDEDEGDGAHPVLLLSWRYWQRRHGGDPGVLGQEITLNGHSFTVVGVVGRGYDGQTVGIRSEVFVPMAMHPVAMPGNRVLFMRRNIPWLSSVVGRVKQGVSIEQARMEVESIAVRLQEEYPDTNDGVEALVVEERESRLHPMIRNRFQLLVILNGVVVGLILMLTCANVAGLLLARSSVRRREISIRLAVGAERSRIVRQVLTESILLALMAGVLGLLLAQGTGPMLQSVMPDIDLPIAVDLRSSPTSIFFVFGISLLAGLVFGFTPAMEASRQDLVTSLTTGRVTAGKRSGRARRLMVSIQVAVSMVLLVMAGMAVVSLQNARRVDVGFNPEGIVEATVFLGLQGFDESEARVFHADAMERLKALPGVEAVSTGSFSQLSPNIDMIGVVPVGWDEPEPPPAVMYNYVDEAYMPTLGIEIERGRNFTLHDDADSETVVIVNRALANRFWPGQDPIGRKVRRSSGAEMTVVGVVPTGKYFSLGEDPRFYIYFPIRSLMQTRLAFYIKVQRVDEPMFQAIRRVFTDLAPGLPAELSPMQGYVDTALLVPRVLAALVSASGLLALLLASIGLYGLIAFSVHQRTPEIGIRIAVGAYRSDILRLVVGGGLRQTAVALGVGLVLGMIASTAVSGMLHGLAPVEPVIVLAALAILLATTVLATWLPARWASRIDPVRALTME